MSERLKPQPKKEIKPKVTFPMPPEIKPRKTKVKLNESLEECFEYYTVNSLGS
jgi:hypothetical protein